ncbi:hypothetical protein I2494_11020 [Budviciaceae bacterium BWR-B9]|uniref:DUF1795 domain-containing protein n=1 Tax=Limnobaculum allomyrinae TaxID=2791986 RepID=A0ABS1IR70_9GAMM|nr:MULTISPECIES: hypothetical protein [Limnobaculum]MBK5144243.1 hypothetical protein [Limnobaculum allomyrinae]MBV7692013.1 hypothetical protein [Limnobaculum sp. M2-1]
MKMFRLMAAVLLAGCNLLSVAQAAERIPGTSVSIEPPAGFSLSKQFTGYMNETAGASIMVNEMPAPLEEIKHAFIPDLMKTEGVRLLGTEEATSHEGKVWLYKIGQTANNQQFNKWILLQGDSKRSLMLVGTYPAAEEAKLGDAIKRSLISMDLAKEEEGKLNLDALGYSVQESDNLKIIRRVNNMLILSLSGDAAPAAAGVQPMMVIASSYSKVAIGDLVAFSEKHMMNTASLIEIAVQKESIKSVDINGHHGVELLANAENAKNHEPMKVYQLIVESDGTYYVIKGLVKAEQSEQYLPEFRKIAESLKITG